MENTEHLAHLSLCQATREHSHWVLASARHTLATMVSGSSIDRDIRSIEHMLRSPDCSCMIATPTDHGSDYIAWAIAHRDGWLAFAFVRESFRRRGIGTHVIASVVEVADSRSIPCANWSLDFSRAAANGYPVRYCLDSRNKFRRMCR